jgi:MFS transporter, MHS family, proline/betaine transporter
MKKIIIAGMIGNGLEWYDYALYAYMTLIISKLFFPAGDESVHLLATLGIFAVGFIARPFGGIFFGIIGDRFGRRAALVSSIFMMAIPTGCIGLLPTYAQIGIWAPIFLTFIRVLQGLSLGGAFCGSMTFLVEHAPPHKRGIVGSTSVASLCIGFLLGSLVSMAVKLPLTDAQFESWGWRIPFLLGIAIGFIGFYIREHCEEPPAYAEAKRSGALSARPVRDAFAHEWRHLLQAIGLYITVTMPFYLLTAYLMTFVQHSLGRSQGEALALNTMVMTIMLIVAPLSALVSDRIGRRKVLAFGAFATLIGIYPVFTLLQSQDFTYIVLAHVIFALINSIYIGPIPAVLVEIFPTRIRYTGMALSYNFSAAAFGGTAPMVCQWLITETGNNYSIAYYVMICAIISLVSLLFYRDRHLDVLR